jgi:hypothetical protein
MSAPPTTLAALLRFGAFPIDRYRPQLAAPRPTAADPAPTAGPLAQALGLDGLRLHATGPHATLYTATARLLGRSVALEVAAHAGPSRVTGKAAQLARLADAAVPRVHAAGFLPAGEAWSLREWIDGRSLAQALVDRTTDGPQLLRRGVAALAAAADALQRAHRAGEVHAAVHAAHVLLPKDPARLVALVGWGGAAPAAGRAAPAGTALAAALVGMLDDLVAAAAQRPHGDPLPAALCACGPALRARVATPGRPTLAEVGAALRRALRATPLAAGSHAAGTSR